MSLTAPTDQDTSVPNDQKGFFEQLKTLLTPNQPKIPAQPDDFQAVVTQGLVTALNGIKDLNEKFSKLTAPPATAPVQQTTTPIAPVEQSVPGANTVQDQLNQALGPILQSLQGMQTQITQLSTTAVNLPPAASGGDTDQVAY